MSLFNTRRGPRSGSSEAASAAVARVQKLKALRSTMGDAKLPPRPVEDVVHPASPAIGTLSASPRKADGTEANWIKPRDTAGAAGGDEASDFEPAFRSQAAFFAAPANVAEELIEPVETSGQDPLAAAFNRARTSDAGDRDEEAAESRPVEPETEDMLSAEADIGETDTVEADAAEAEEPAARQEAPGEFYSGAAFEHSDDDERADEDAGTGDADLSALSEPAEPFADAPRPETSAPTFAGPGSWPDEAAEDDARPEATSGFEPRADSAGNAGFAMPIPGDYSAQEESDETPSVGRGRRGRLRNKTRLLGFDHAESAKNALFAAAFEGDAAATTQPETTGGTVRYPVGWIVVAQGPGAGHAFALFKGVSQIGRAENQTIRLDFGDTSISRECHAAIAYDEEDHSLTLAQTGKANIVRLNGRPVLSNETLSDGDIIRIGTTHLRVVQLCTPAFNWDAVSEGDRA